uniref:Uncharacterized protein n=1 Tax=Pyxicephalus adspersus TaxID=30357 RepID=A0AAV3AHZ6_PYXAD|nr:TPA: hypothetical protein GDO54_012485 [Pyxicephalus adspersus]
MKPRGDALEFCWSCLTGGTMSCIVASSEAFISFNIIFRTVSVSISISSLAIVTFSVAFFSLSLAFIPFSMTLVSISVAFIISSKAF